MTPAWSHWAVQHLREMRVLHAAGILGPENHKWRNVAEHSLVVNATAIYLAELLQASGQIIDMDTVDKASMLHDATKRLDRERGVSYANEHDSSIRRNFLTTLGYSEEVISATEYTGRVPELFIRNPFEQHKAILATPLTHLTVAYADARVRNTNIVPLESARDLNKLKIPADAAVYDVWYDFYHRVEHRLFASLVSVNFTPTDLNEENVTQRVKQRYLDESEPPEEAS